MPDGIPCIISSYIIPKLIQFAHTHTHTNNKKLVLSYHYQHLKAISLANQQYLLRVY